MPRKKSLIEWGYQLAEACGLPLWNQDEAGPYATRPQPGASWQLEGRPNLQPHEYLRDGGAKLMTLFRPATGEVRAKGVVSVTREPFSATGRSGRLPAFRSLQTLAGGVMAGMARKAKAGP